MTRTKVITTGVLLLAIGSAASAAVRIEGESGSYSSIQSALNAADDGDVVLVDYGVYNESINPLGKALTVRGVPASNGSLPVLDGTGLDQSIVTLVDDEGWETVFENLELRNGEGTLISSRRMGGAVRISGGGATFRNVTFSNNGANAGGSVASQGGLTLFVDCRFDGNEAHSLIHGGGAAMYLHTSFTVIANSRFVGNDASDTHGGAIAAYSGQTVVLNSIFADNAALIGGALYQNAGHLEVHNSTVYRNVSHYTGAAITAMNDVGLVVTNSILYDNVNDGAESFLPGEVVRMSGVVESNLDVSHSLLTPGSHDPSEPFLHEVLFDDTSFVSDDRDSEDYLRLTANAPGHDAGNAGLLPYDWADLDGEGDYYEDLPKAYGASTEDQPGFQDRILGAGLDLGAHERPDADSGDPDPPTCEERGDLNGDGHMDLRDLILLLMLWGHVDESGDEITDLDGNGLVGNPDMIILLTNWGECSEG